jgi:NAD(P)-dependent dehydrogenase (short-subunit alcohol dehydrogenase family)
VQGDISDVGEIEKCIAAARERFGPIHILAANTGITDEPNEYPIWEMPAELWDRTYQVNVRGTFSPSSISWDLQGSAKISQNESSLLLLDSEANVSEPLGVSAVSSDKPAM